jgi:hypothetical protein
VEGGIKNNISNALDALKISAGKLGLAINSAFDVSGNLERFATFITDAANAFNNLSDSTKKPFWYSPDYWRPPGLWQRLSAHFRQLLSSFAVTMVGGTIATASRISYLRNYSVLRTAFLAIKRNRTGICRHWYLQSLFVALINCFGGFDKAAYRSSQRRNRTLNEASQIGS